jgi:hypothetical protein
LGSKVIASIKWQTLNDGVINTGIDNIHTNTTVPAIPGFITANSIYSSTYSAEKAIDGIFGDDNANVWFAQHTDTAPWLKFNFEQQDKKISSYRLARGYCAWDAYVPSRWKVYGSHDNASWQLLHDVTADQVNASTCSTFSSVYSFSNNIAYRYYRFNFDVSNYSYSVSIAEIELFE